MKSIKVLIIFTILLSSCIITKPVLTLNRKNNLYEDTIQIKKDIAFLCSINPPRNNKNLNSLDTAANYIKAEFEKLSCKTEIQKYYGKGGEYKNIIASFGTENKKRIIVGAHYDVCENTPGSDDNASGVAAILQIARLIDSLKPKLKYRIDIVAFSTEEPPYQGIPMGSYIHASSLVKDTANVKLMICLDMIGFYMYEKNSQYYPVKQIKYFYPSAADYAIILSKFGEGRYSKHLKKKMRQVSDIKLRSANLPGKVNFLYLSDHANYWTKNYNAILITNTATLRNDNYHETTDTPETLDYYNIDEIARGVYWYISHN